MDIDERSDVGIGVVYEQFMLNRLLLRITYKHKIKTALEVPIFGMAGLCGINSMALASEGIEVTLADLDPAHLEEAKAAWSAAGRMARFELLDGSGRLPFQDSSFDLVFNFAALWHLEGDEPRIMLEEMARVSNGLVMICMPNAWNPMHVIRKTLGRLPKNPEWSDMRNIRKMLTSSGLKLVEEGLLDIPPWPDTVVPVKDVMGKLGMRKKSGTWRWSMLDYYSGKSPLIKEKLDRYAFIEDSWLPAGLKSLWAHHRFIIAKKE